MEILGESRISHCIGRLLTMMYIKRLFDFTEVQSHRHSNEEGTQSTLRITVTLSLSLVNTVQFSSVAQSCPTLCNPMDSSMPGLPVHHQLPELTRTHVHRVSDAIQPAHPLSSPSPPAFSLIGPSYFRASTLDWDLDCLLPKLTGLKFQLYCQIFWASSLQTVDPWNS